MVLLPAFPNRIALEQVPSKIRAIYEDEYQQALTAWNHGGQQGRKPHAASYHGWDYQLEKWQAEYDHPLWKRMGEQAVRNGGHGGMDFVMMWRIVYCLRHGQPLDQDVYDAAAWSSISPLSAVSVADRSNSKTIPDFTRGAWRTGKPLSIVS